MGHRARWAVVFACVSAVMAFVGVGGAGAATVTVCSSGCAFSQIAPAIAAANPGDTIKVGAGTYDGGFTIDKSLQLVGAGAAATIISGGGPVITIGVAFAASEPTVSISGVTITGGVSTSSRECGPACGTDYVTATALGGGIEVPPGSGSTGASVTINDSVISGNRASPTRTVPSVRAICPGEVPCRFALAGGGGIDNWGAMTLVRSTVTGNEVSGAVSDADGGGILNMGGTLTLANSVITGNRASASAPNGRFADSGALFLAGGTLAMSNSSVTNNSATLAAAFPSSVGVGVHAGAMHFSQNAQSATISNTTISGNAATMTNSVGDAFADSGGVHTDIDVSVNDHLVTLSNDVIANNHVTASTVDGSSGNADGSSGAGEISGTLNNIRLTGNTVDVRSATGSANGEGGASVYDGGSFTNSLIGDNHVHVSAPGGSATVQGGGIFVAVSLTLRNSTVNGNTGDASGASGSARGGGIFDAAFPFGPDGPPGGPLVLQNSKLTDNVLTGSPGFTLQGGGLYIRNEPLTSTNTVIANNVPDQCFGC
jgi:hypothetical protein